MDAESRVSTFERLNKDLNRQITEIQENLENETRDKSTMAAKMRWDWGLVVLLAHIIHLTVELTARYFNLGLEKGGPELFGNHFQ